MRVTGPWIKYLLLAALVGGAVLIAVRRPGSPSNEKHTVHIPMLSELGRKGMIAFNSNCAQCHGSDGSGTEKGPPLIHRVYHPGHHGDAAFALAVKVGVRQHHWRFGDMPPVAGVGEKQVTEIVAYIRELQRANGIQ